MAVQLLNYAVPLAAIPLLIRGLGVETYAVVAIATTVYYLMSVLVDLGMNLSATYQYSVDRSADVARKLLGVTLAVQALAFMTAFAALSFALPLFGSFSDHRAFISGFSISALLQGIFPLWYFAAERRLAVASLVLTTGKAVYLVILIATVRGPEDLPYVALAQCASWALPAAIAYIMISRRGLNPIAPGWHLIRLQVRLGWGFFQSRVAQVVYTTGGNLYLAATGTPVQLAYYSAIEQGFRGAQGLANAVQQSLFPMMAALRDLRLLKQALIVMTCATIVGAVVVAVLSRDLVLIALGAEMLPAVNVLLVFLVVIVLDVPATIIGYPLYAALQRPDLANLSVVWAAIIAIALYGLIWVAGMKQAWEVALVALMVEAFLLGYRGLRARSLVRSEVS